MSFPGNTIYISRLLKGAFLLLLLFSMSACSSYRRQAFYAPKLTESIALRTDSATVPVATVAVKENTAHDIVHESKAGRKPDKINTRRWVSYWKSAKAPHEVQQEVREAARAVHPRLLATSARHVNYLETSKVILMVVVAAILIALTAIILFQATHNSNLTLLVVGFLVIVTAVSFITIFTY